MPEKAILAAALAKRDPADRANYLHQVCGGDVDLLRRIEAQLSCLAPTESADLPRPSESETGTRAPTASIASDAGGLLIPESARVEVEQKCARERQTRIGPYLLGDCLGRGGMGIVWRAEQQQPLRRQVALKIIRPGLDSANVIARFEQERQALALMDHPNIAKVLDAGTTADGRPFFVMELVDGLPINRFCDEKRLAIRERLELFINVCHAVQHAHQKGIIHRDLKPSNVLVSSYDGRSIPKVIDFGVAKATSQELFEREPATEVGAVVGTFEYMSPEQADLGNLDIDTRADVYSLGGILYQLLTGSPPFSSQRLRSSPLDEALRTIREVDPPRPSIRLADSSDLPTIAVQRRSSPTALTRLIGGDLDWIVAKALDKDRSRRYETANGLALDIQRYLSSEPVLATPPSTVYRLAKFVRKNRVAVIAIASVFLALTVGLAGTSVALVWANWERHRKDQALVALGNEQTKTKAALEAEKASLKEATEAGQRTMDALRALTDKVVERQISQGTTLTDEDRKFLEDVVKQYSAFAALKGDRPESRAIRAEGMYRVALMQVQLGEHTAATRNFDESMVLWKQLCAQAPAEPRFRQELAKAHLGLGSLLTRLSQYGTAETEFRTALELQQELAASPFVSVQGLYEMANTREALGDCLAATSRYQEAEKEYRSALAAVEKLAADSPTPAKYRVAEADCLLSLAGALRGLGKREAAVEEAGKAVLIGEQLVAEHPAIPEYRRSLAAAHVSEASLLWYLGRHQDGVNGYREALAIRRQLVADYPTVPAYRDSLVVNQRQLATLLMRLGRLAEAEPECQQAFAIQAQLVRDFPKVPAYRQGLATCHFMMREYFEGAGKSNEATAESNKAIAILRQLITDRPDPASVELRETQARIHNALSAELRSNGELEEAKTERRRAITIQQSLAKEFPFVPGYRKNLALGYHNLGGLLIDQRQWADADQQLKRRSRPWNS